jgi:hypothetical protein
MRLTSSGGLELGYNGAARQQADSQAFTIVTPANGGGQGIALKRLDSNNDQQLGEISWSNNTQDGLGGIIMKTTGAANSTMMRLQTSNAGTVDDKLVIVPNGNVGIGRTPDSVYSGSMQLAFGNGAQLGTSTSGNPNLTLTDNSYLDTSGNYIYKTSNPATRLELFNGTLTFGNAASGTAGNSFTYAERMRIEASGNLLVGNTVVNPASGFATQRGFGYEASTGQVEIAATSDIAPLELGRNHADDGSIVVFRKQSVIVGSIGAFSGDLYIGTGDTTLKFEDGSDRIVPRGTAGAQRDGSISLGSTGNRFKDLYLSGAAKTDTISNEGSGTTTTSTTQTAIATFPHASYDSAKVIITANDGTDVYTTELLIVHNGTTASAAEYGQVGTGSALATYDVDINGTDVRVLATAAAATSTTFKVTKILL